MKHVSAPSCDRIAFLNHTQTVQAGEEHEMKRINIRDAVVHGEEGHGMPLIGALIGGAGAIVLAIGSANGTGALAIVGGIVLAVGLVAMLVIQHTKVEWDILARLDKLEKK